MMSNKCYKFEERIFNSGFLDQSVDATYILHLEGNGRLESINKQLTIYQPTKIVYILFNRGFKKCEKPSYIDSSTTDLIDGNIQIFKHARENNYRNILILEDDFIFSDKILSPEIQYRINSFLVECGDSSFIYSLGCIPLLQFPIGEGYHYKSKFIGTHACIFSKAYRENILSKDQSSMKDWDVAINPIAYTYHIPLCYQLFPNTENQKTWYDDNIFSKMAYILTKFIIFIFSLDTRYEPGYSILYTMSKILSFIIFIFFIVFACYIIIRICKHIRG